MAGTTPINSTPTGVEGLVYAILTDEVLNTYSAVLPVSPLINIKVAPKVSGDSLYADNLPVERVVVIGDVAVTIESADLPLPVQAAFCGNTIDAATGIVTHNYADKPPYVAIGFKIRKANNHYRYVWLLKGMFEETTVEGLTQEDKAKFTTPKLVATFLARADGNWKFTADDDSGTAPVNTTFLSAVHPGTV